MIVICSCCNKPTDEMAPSWCTNHENHWPALEDEEYPQVCNDCRCLIPCKEDEE